MKRYISLAFLIALPVISGNVLAERKEMVFGSWEFDVKYDLIGIPQSFPGYTVTQCIDDSTPFPNISLPGDECQMQLQGRFVRTYTWMVNCSTDWEMVQGMGRIHYNRDRAHGDVHLQILNPHNPPQPMVFRIKGHYLGNCEK